MRFATPLVLLLIVPVVFLILALKKRTPSLLFSRTEDLGASGSVGWKTLLFEPDSFLKLLRTIGLILLIVALARPQSGRKQTEILSEGIDIILTIDTSGSMQALDFEVDGKRANRLEAIKDVVSDFIQDRPGDRLGMVVFGEEAFTQAPLTLDHGLLKSLLSRLEIGIAGDATAIGQAIGVGINRLKSLKAKSKVMILLTDGRNNAGDLPPLKAAEIAASYGIKIYTIGVGTLGPAPFEVDSLFGKRLVYQQADLDEPTLKKISETTKARYFRATDTNSLKEIYAEINHLEKSAALVKEYTEYDELYQRFLIPGLLTLLLETLLSRTILRRIP